MGQATHCAVMCGPSYASKKSKEKNFYLFGRMVSYSLLGIAGGLFGESLKSSLSSEFLRMIGFIFFFLISVFMLFKILPPSLIPFLIKRNSNFFLREKLSFCGRLRNFGDSLRKYPFQITLLTDQQIAGLQGFLSVTLPCSLVYQMFSFAVISKSWIAGFFIGSLYSFFTGGVLHLGSLLANKILFNKNEMMGFALRTLMFFLITFNLYVFTKSFLHASNFGNPENIEKSLFEKIFCG